MTNLVWAKYNLLNIVCHELIDLSILKLETKSSTSSPLQRLLNKDVESSPHYFKFKWKRSSLHVSKNVAIILKDNMLYGLCFADGKIVIQQNMFTWRRLNTFESNEWNKIICWKTDSILKVWKLFIFKGGRNKRCCITFNNNERKYSK